MIVNTAWRSILTTALDLNYVVEVYSSDQTPTATGFDPADAIGRYAAVSDVTYLAHNYTRLVKSFGSISRSMDGKSTSASVDFSNVSRNISRFEFANGFEGLIMVIRLISRESSTTLALSQIIFAGRCEKPTSGTKDSLSIKASWILGGVDTVKVPRRKFVPEDPEGRVSTDPEFEGFIYIPTYNQVTYSVREKRGGIAGLFGFKKTVQKTLQYSSASDLLTNSVVPEVFGRAQLKGTHIAYDDVGTALRMETAWCEGPILSIGSNGSDPTHVRSNDPRLPLHPTTYTAGLGLVGVLNGRDLTWIAPGYYSRTVNTRSQANGSSVTVYDPAPDLIGIILGRLMTVPTTGGAWTVTDTWTDNGAAHVWFIITSEFYFKLDPNWLDSAAFFETYKYNAENIVDRSLSDFIFTIDGN